MGSFFSSEPRFYDGRKLLTGQHTVQRGSLIYSGEFDVGFLQYGSVTKDMGSLPPKVLSSGKYKYNKLIQGSKIENLQSLINQYVPDELMEYFDEYGDESDAYILGFYYVADHGLDEPVLDRVSTIYYDKERTRKFIDGTFDKGKLKSGSIFADNKNNTLLVTSEFAYDEKNDICLKSGVLIDDVKVTGVIDTRLYLKISPLLLGCVTYKNNYTGFAEYYKEPFLRNLVVKCNLVDGKIHGNFVYFTNNNVYASGIVEDGEFIKGVMKYDGFYVQGDYQNGEPHGIVTIYHDSDCTRKYANANYDNGNLNGMLTLFDESENEIGSHIYSRDILVETTKNRSLLNNVDEDNLNSERFQVTKDTETKTTYPRYATTINKHDSEKTSYFVRESDLIAAQDEIQQLKDRLECFSERYGSPDVEIKTPEKQTHNNSLKV